MQNALRQNYCGARSAISSGPALYSVLFTHNQPPIAPWKYTISRIISRTAGTSLLRFILRESLVRAWRERARTYMTVGVSSAVVFYKCKILFGMQIED